MDNASTIVQQTRPQTGVDLSLIQQNGDTLASSDGGDRYTGLNRFDEVIDQNWVNPNTDASTDRFQYAYDSVGNVLFKNNLVHAADSELYHTSSTTSGDNATAYDPLDRLTSFVRGTLSSSGNNGSSLDKVANASINTAAASDETWTLDAVGNWISSATAAGTGTSTPPSFCSTSQSHNDRNELTAVGGNSMAQNNDGATTTDSDGYAYTYDAWGHLLTATLCGCGTSATYAYDATGREIVDAACACSPHNLYYSQAGQVADETYSCSSCCSFGGMDWSLPCGCGTCVAGTFVCSCTTNYDYQNVNGAGYVDDLVLRDEVQNNTSVEEFFPTGFSPYQVTSTNNTTITRLFVQQDANYNVTAITDTSGGVLERFVYDPYGNQQVLTSSWSPTSDAYNWLYGFQGGRTDAVTGLIHFGARDYSPSDGRWVEPDPAGYIDGMNDYQVESGDPEGLVDPDGTDAAPGAWSPVGRTSFMLMNHQMLMAAGLSNSEAWEAENQATVPYVPSLNDQLSDVGLDTSKCISTSHFSGSGRNYTAYSDGTKTVYSIDLNYAKAHWLSTTVITGSQRLYFRDAAAIQAFDNVIPTLLATTDAVMFVSGAAIGAAANMSTSCKQSGSSYANSQGAARIARERAAAAAENAAANNAPLKNPPTGEPGSQSTVNNPDGSPKQVRQYGQDGNPQTDVDYGHGHELGPDGNPVGSPHAHDWTPNPNGGFPNAVYPDRCNLAIQNLEEVITMANMIINKEDFVVQEPHLHDSLLTSIAIEENSVHLRFKTLTMKIVRVSLIGLRGLSLESMFEQNILFEMRITPPKAFPRDFRRVFHQSGDIEISDARLNELKSENFVFVQIDPAVGADILALCREVTWQFEL